MATAHAPGFPLPLRNALAELAIAALDDDDAAAALGWLASPGPRAPAALATRLAAVHLLGDDGALLGVHRPHGDAIHRHAVRALRAAAARRAGIPAGDTPIGRACAAAVALWNEGLFFEVHEVLERVWASATGPARHALQGVIQIAVALHHHAHGNARGARTLMRDGRERLTANRSALPALDVDALLAATAAWQTGLDAGSLARDATPPPLHACERPAD